MGRIRLHVALDCSGYSLETFILDNIESGATIATHKWPSYNIIDKEQGDLQAVLDNLYNLASDY